MIPHKGLPVIVIGLFFGAATAQDILTPQVTSELSNECRNETTFTFCVTALKQHGQGKDDLALGTLSAAVGASARIHYKIAQARLGEKFWKLAAQAGSPPVDCDAGLSGTLNLHFGLKPEALAAADDDYNKSNFVALADLLGSIPAQGFPATPTLDAQSRIQVADVYRYCFSNPDQMFGLLRHKLGR